MGRPRKFSSVKALETAWEEYKAWCNNQTVMTHGFSQKSSEFVSAELKRRVTYTVEGFCAWAGLARQSFYMTYANNPKFSDTVTRMKEESEMDARMKFELGDIDPRLAALWMGNYGYSAKADAVISDAPPVQIIDDITRDEND